MDDDDTPSFYPDTETRRQSERHTRAVEATNLVAEIEARMRNAEPNSAVEVTHEEMELIRQHPEILNRHPLLAEREHTHGDFAATAQIAQRFKEIAKASPNWAGQHLTDIQRESLDGMFVKIARILSGDPNHPDHWRDVEGQAHLVIETLAPF